MTCYLNALSNNLSLLRTKYSKSFPFYSRGELKWKKRIEI